MAASRAPPTGPQLLSDSDLDPRRWLYAGVVALLALLGVSVLIAVVVPVVRSGIPAGAVSAAPWDWLLGLFAIVIAIWIAIAIFRLIAWGIFGPGYGYRHYRPAGRYYHRHWAGPFDDAVAAARERYARGEISRDQFDQILRDLSRPPGYPPAT